MARPSANQATIPSPILAIAGGFLRVEVAQLHRAWHACRAGRGGSTDFRAWLAALEMRARRGPSGRAKAHARDARGLERRPAFGVAELAHLCAIGERRAAAAVRKLGQLGLLDWDAAGRAIESPTPTGGDRPAEAPQESPLDDSLPGRSGVVALPRRVVRFLARGAKPAVIATALGVLLRCVSRRRAGWAARGRVKASWIAETFAVDARRVKAARAELAQLGWLRAAEGADPQWAWNRWGRAYVVDLAWSAPARPAAIEAKVTRRPDPTPTLTSPPTPGADCHPVPPSVGPELPPPDLDPDPVPEKKNPDPGSARPIGVDVRHRVDESSPSSLQQRTTRSSSLGEKGVDPTSDPAYKRTRLNQIAPEDLAQLDRTLVLYAAAIRAGWVAGAEADRLRFVAAATHARGIGATNPAGLFRAIVQGKRWHLITQADEDQARARLRLHDQVGTGSNPAPRRPGPPDRPGATAVSDLGLLLDRFSPRLAGFGAALRPASRPNPILGRAVS